MSCCLVNIVKTLISFLRSSGYNDELCSGALWLYRLTGEQKYLDYAFEFYSDNVPWALSWDEKTPSNQVLCLIVALRKSCLIDVSNNIYWDLPNYVGDEELNSIRKILKYNLKCSKPF